MSGSDEESGKGELLVKVQYILESGAAEATHDDDVYL